MLQSLKYILVSVIIIVLMLFGMLINRQSTANEKATTKVEALLESSMLGYTRAEGIDGGISKKEFVANLVDSVVETQKNKNNVIIFYTFLDKDGNATTEEKEINSVQFKTNLISTKDFEKLQAKLGANFNMNQDITLKTKEYKFKASNLSEKDTPYIVENGESSITQNAIDAMSTAISLKRISLDSIDYRTEQDPETLTYKGYAGVYSNADEQEIVVSDLLNPKEITSVELINGSTGSISHEFDKASGTVSIKVSGGSPVKVTTDSGGISEISKEVNLPLNDSNVDSSGFYKDSEGYTGILSKVTTSGLYQEALKKYISSYTKADYSDSYGFKGTLTRDSQPITGFFVPQGSMRIAGYEDAYYDDGIYAGHLNQYDIKIPTNENTELKNITNHDSENYSDSEGFTGQLSSGLVGFAYKRIDNYIKKYSDLYDTSLFEEAMYTEIPYTDTEDYNGDLHLMTTTFVPDGNVDNYYLSQNSNMVYDVDSSKPTSKPTASGNWYAEKVYTAYEYSNLTSSVASDEESSLGEDTEYPVENLYFPADSASKANFEKYANKTVFNSYSNVDDYKKNHTDIDFSKATKREVSVVRWTWKRNLGQYYLTYGGEVMKAKIGYSGIAYKVPKGVTPTYKTVSRYKGLVYREQKDTRVYGYSGFVTTDSLDNREYQWQGVVTKSEKVTSSSEDIYGYNFKITYKRDLGDDEDVLESEESSE